MYAGMPAMYCRCWQGACLSTLRACELIPRAFVREVHLCVFAFKVHMLSFLLSKTLNVALFFSSSSRHAPEKWHKTITCTFCAGLVDDLHPGREKAQDHNHIHRNDGADHAVQRITPVVHHFLSAVGDYSLKISGLFL